MSDDERFMREALDCARRGRGAVEPNPMVGAVIAHGGREVSRGWHGRFGGPHAEVEALAAARGRGADVRGATMYVTLEPCCHHGKTPPCTEAIIAAGIARVVVAMADPDEKVRGGGIARLRSAGIEVAVGVLEADARRLLAPYVKLRTRGRPWVICKWGQTGAGYLAVPPRARPVGTRGGEGRWISGEESREYVHELRGLCDGVLVGIGTVLADDPLLTNRSGRGGQPARVVLDSHLRTPPDCRLVLTAAESPVIVATRVGEPGRSMEGGARARSSAGDALARAGVEVIELPGGPGGVDAGALLDELGRRQWTYLLVEGGATVLRSFVLGGLADELLAFVAKREARPPAASAGGLPRFDVAELGDLSGAPPAERRKLGHDTLLRYVVAN
jgi:diaminohydroxyphosphoribosylaminopyrimidine deaminase/5-amino-6-(5-phosphoribosylamino)uracil reductase